MIFTRTRLESNISGFGSKFTISSIRDSICRKSVIRLRCKGTWCWHLTAETFKSELIVKVDWISTDRSSSFSCRICKVLLDEYHVLHQPIGLTLFQLYSKAVHLILLQLLRLQSVLVENLRKKKTLLKVFMTALFKSNKIVYDSLWIASRILKSSCLICILVQIGRHGTRLVIPYKFYS